MINNKKECVWGSHSPKRGEPHEMLAMQFKEYSVKW